MLAPPTVGMLIDQKLRVDPDDSDWFFNGEVIAVDHTWGQNSFTIQDLRGAVVTREADCWNEYHYRQHIPGTSENR